MKNPAIILTIAGSDSSGGAGIQADIKTISALGGYAASVITNLGTELTPGFRVETDAGLYYISAIDAQIIDI